MIENPYFDKKMVATNQYFTCIRDDIHHTVHEFEQLFAQWLLCTEKFANIFASVELRPDTLPFFQSHAIRYKKKEFPLSYWSIVKPLWWCFQRRIILYVNRNFNKTFSISKMKFRHCRFLLQQIRYTLLSLSLCSRATYSKCAFV